MSKVLKVTDVDGNKHPFGVNLWSGWFLIRDDDGSIWKENYSKDQSGYIHILTTAPDESNPDDNHVHVKYIQGEPFILCSVKLDGAHPINRRILIERINEVLGLDLPYR
jgi:hypothetical protein